MFFASCDGFDEEGIEVESVEIFCTAMDLFEEFCASDDVVEGFDAEFSEDFLDFVGDEGEEVDNFFGSSGKFFDEFGILGADADGTCIGVALSDHEASHSDEACGSDTKFFCPEYGGNDDISPCFESAIGAKFDAFTLLVEAEDLVDFRKADFPGYAGVFYGALGACTCASGVA